jgi:hypothetical protein
MLSSGPRSLLFLLGAVAGTLFTAWGLWGLYVGIANVDPGSEIHGGSRSFSRSLCLRSDSGSWRSSGRYSDERAPGLGQTETSLLQPVSARPEETQRTHPHQVKTPEARRSCGARDEIL